MRVRSHLNRQGCQARRDADDEGDVGARDAGARHEPAPGHARGTDEDHQELSAVPARRLAIDIADGLQGQGEVGGEMEERRASVLINSV